MMHVLALELNGVDGVAHFVADSGVDDLIQLLLGLDLVDHDALGDVVDLDHAVGCSLALVDLFPHLNESEVRAI